MFQENVALTLAGAADVRCFPVFMVTGGAAGSTGGRTLGGALLSMFVTSRPIKQQRKETKCNDAVDADDTERLSKKSGPDRTTAGSDVTGSTPWNMH